MKRVSQLTTLALSLLLGSGLVSHACAAAPDQATLAQIQQQRGAIIDTRPSAFFNGWPAPQGATSGHEPQALNLSATWLDAMSDDQLAAWARQHQLMPDTPIALYGDSEQVAAVRKRLRGIKFTHLVLLQDALRDNARLQRLAHFEQLVYPQWLFDLQHHKPVIAKPQGDWKVFEAGWGAPKRYLLSHIPGAGYIDTNEVESEPLWNTVSAPALKAMLAKHGVRHDTTVILYSRDVYAAARVAQIMLYAGVSDVRLLDGGWQTWSAADLPVERGLPSPQPPAADFGVTIPAQPQLMLNTEQARALLHRNDASLVSIRSWPEFIGTTSGYSYIKPKGDIAGARWGHAGSDSTHMEDFHNPDGTMRSAGDIESMWAGWHIRPDQQVAFYCGTGWRAAETFMYARAMGWKNIALYDGGWYEWSSDPHNPVATGPRTPDSTR
ncbi:sulfurtransferase [Shimwellia pseudoproteus]|uniref:rhodanese-like domain-containing protein n=1 Tax=Shimwellia pseudoproteus TaxID=570012 RepID=UPI0018EC20CD|nr:rhodanese-like domain-containing protein [Shimwellia pseudoproteus]MBJ3813951.1 sulfurtransferase [Shimwellia pseudoproteus]